MRIPRIVLAVLLLGTPIAAVAFTATTAAAEPFTYSSVDVTQGTACAITNDGTAVCWGENRYQWLIGNSYEEIIRVPTKVALPNNDRFVQLSGGGNHTWCGLATSGKVYCWGEHHIGSYFTTSTRTPVPVEFTSPGTYTKVGSGYEIGCALNTSGELWCWGDILATGSGETEGNRLPVKVAIPNNETVVDFDLGGTPCAVTSIGNIYCWGHSNGAGQLGIGYPSHIPYAVSVLPTKVVTPSGVQFTSVTSGLEHVCAVSTTGVGYCWGDNYMGLFGNNTYDDSYVPTPMTVPNNEAIAEISTGWYHTCIVTVSHKMWCFGRGDEKELGTGTSLGGKTYRAPYIPSDIVLSRIAVSISGSCALDQFDRVWCWGGLSAFTALNKTASSGWFPEVIPAVGPPTSVTNASTSVDAETATLNAEVNPNGYATTVAFEYDTRADFSTAIRTSTITTLRALTFTSTTLSRTVDSLAPRTQYFARVIATNTFGTALGSTQTFTTLGSEPVVSDLTSERIAGNSASISVDVHPSRLSTGTNLEYSSDPLFSSGVVQISLPNCTGNQVQTFGAQLSSLRARTEYFVRVTSTNRLGSTTSSTHSFSTIGQLPTVGITNVSSGLTFISANVSIGAGDLDGTVALQVSTSLSFASISNQVSDSFVNGGNTQFTLAVQGLTNRTNYFVRAVATNELGSVTSEIVELRTKGGVPVVSTPTVYTTDTFATASFQLDTTGLNTVVTALVSDSPILKNGTEHYVSTTSGSSLVSFQVPHIDARTTYFIRFSAKNDAGTTTTDIIEFTLDAPIGFVINNDDDTTDNPRVTLNFNPPSGTELVRVANNAQFKQARIFYSLEDLAWDLPTGTSESQDRTVWVQFIDSVGRVTTYTDDILLFSDLSEEDTTAPVVVALRVISAKTASVGVSATRSNEVVKRSVVVSARDARSGIAKVQTRIGSKIYSVKVDAARSGKYLVAFPARVTTMQIRVVDRAGNVSSWAKVKSR